ncbi:MAG: ATP synthase F0 subunit B [Treponema sp.]|jgi:hypothetical protein|nr:ATP synthase F0 subunit B [Treponema sp.]
MKRFGLLLFLFFMLILSLYAKGNREHSQTSISPYTGDGGANISITIKAPVPERLPPILANTHIDSYRRLLDNFLRYSGITIRPDFDIDPSLYREVLSGYYDDDDEAGSDLGHLRMTEYLMTGSISQSPTSYRFYLQVVKTAANDKSVAFSYEANCTYSDLSSLSIVNRASLDLLEKMGVKLTEAARTELAGADATNRAKGKTVMLDAVAAQKAGNDAEARFLLNQAAELDAQLAEEAERRLSEMGKPLAMLSVEKILSPTLLPPPQLQAPQLQDFVPIPETEIPPPAKTTGNLGNDARARQQAYEIERENARRKAEVDAENERIREENARRKAAVEAENARRKAEVDAENARRKAEVDAENERRKAAVDAENAARDAHNKEIWVKALADSEGYYRKYLTTLIPFELVYENKIDDMPETQDFENETISVKFNAALVPVEMGWARAVENDVNNLRSQLLATGRAKAWDIANWPQIPVTNPAPFVNRSGSVTADVELLNDKGKVLGKQTFSFGWNLTTSFSAKGLSFSINEDKLSSQFVLFKSINIYDITEALQIRIVRINGQDAEKAAAQGGIQYGTDYQRWKPIEQGQHNRAALDEKRKAKEERRYTREISRDRFLENHSIRFGGWGEPRQDSNIGYAGGGAIELCWLRPNPGAFQFLGYSSLQTGVTIFQDKDEPLSEPIVTKTVIQFPVLGRAGFNMQGTKGTAGIDASIHGGIGINLFLTDQIELLSSSLFSFIVGGEVAWTGRYQSLFISYQFNRDLTNTEYRLYGENYSYSGSRNIVGVGLKWLIPFRKY